MTIRTKDALFTAVSYVSDTVGNPNLLGAEVWCYKINIGLYFNCISKYV